MAVDDAYTVSLLHFNSLDAATITGDESGKQWTPNGNAQIDTAQFKFGVSSLLLDGTGDYLTALDSSDWFMSTGDFTIDFWIRENSLGALNTIFSQRTDANNNVVCTVSTLGVITFTITATTPVVTMASASGVITTNTWYHIAIVRNGNAWNIYVNGTSVASTTDSDAWADYTGTFQIGADNGGNGFNGWIDEFRVSKGIARWTTTFTPPTTEYAAYTYAPDDGSTVFLSHFDGADGAQVAYDEVQKIIQFFGNAQIDTAQSKFGGASLLLDGTGDYLTLADSADWRLDGGSNSNTWTIDFWVRFNGDPSGAINGLVQQFQDGNNLWSINFSSTDTLRFQILSGGVVTVSINNAWNPASATWYHIAVVKNGTTGYMMFVDGTQIGTTQTDTDVMPDFTGTLEIGKSASGSYLNGWMDEVRISKGIARWTSNFTPPTAPYAPPSIGNSAAASPFMIF